MKKRRELDALVNGKLGKGRKSKKGGHELLHNETDSSEVDEFSLSSQKTVVRHGPSRLCATCIPFCGFFLLVACVVGVVGLAWVHIKLRNDLDHIRTQLRAVESGNKNTPDTFQQIHSKLKSVEDSVKRLQTDTSDHVASLSAVKIQLSKLQGTSDALQNKLKDSPALENLPQSVENLSKNVAGFGSEIKSLQANMDSLMKFKTDIQTSLSGIQGRLKKLETSVYVSTTVAPPVGSTASPAVNKYLQDHIDDLSHDLFLVNNTMATHLSELAAKLKIQQDKISEIKNKTSEVQARLGLLEISSSSASNKPNMSDIQAAISEAVNNVMTQLHNTTNYAPGVSQDSIQDLSSQIQNITSMVVDYRAQFDKFKSDWETGKMDNINFNMPDGMKSIEKAVDSYTSGFDGQLKFLNKAVTDLNSKVKTLEDSVHAQQLILSTLTNHTTEPQGTGGQSSNTTLPPIGDQATLTPSTAITAEKTTQKTTSPTISIGTTTVPTVSSTTTATTTATAATTSTPATTISSTVASTTTTEANAEAQENAESDKSQFPFEKTSGSKKTSKHGKSHKHHKASSTTAKPAAKRSDDSKVPGFSDTIEGEVNEEH